MTDFIYIPDNYAGHRPANREVVEVYQHGTIFSIPECTTMHMHMAVQLRKDVTLAEMDAAFHGAGDVLPRVEVS